MVRSLRSVRVSQLLASDGFLTVQILRSLFGDVGLVSHDCDAGVTKVTEFVFSIL